MMLQSSCLALTIQYMLSPLRSLLGCAIAMFMDHSWPLYAFLEGLSFFGASGFVSSRQMMVLVQVGGPAFTFLVV